MTMTSEAMTDQQTRTYLIRWMFLLISALTQIGSMLSFVGYSPVANIIDAYYGDGTNNTLGLIFTGVTVPVYIICIWLTSRVGLRWLILLCLALTTFGNGMRGVSVIDGPSIEMKKMILYVGHGIAAAGGPIVMFLPTKVSSVWFPPSERAISTSLNSVSSPFGILLINLIIPRIITSKSDLLVLNIIAFAVPCAALVLGLITIRRNAPAIPPSISASDPSLPLKEGLLICVKCRPYLILAGCVGAGIGLFNGLFVLMEKLLCIRGYDNAFSGLVTAMMIVGGMIGATIAGLVVDKTKLFVETLKVTMPLACFFGICFSIAAHYNQIKLLILATAILFGFFGLAFYGIGLEMGAECTYPVNETTSAGLLGFIGQIQSFIFLLMFDWLTKPATGSDLEHQVCTTDLEKEHELRDYNNALIAISVIGTVIVLVFVPFFRPEYKRMKIENRPVDSTPVLRF